MKNTIVFLVLVLFLTLSGCQKKKKELVGQWKRVWYTGLDHRMCAPPIFVFHKGNSFTEILNYCDDRTGRYCVRGETIKFTYKYKDKPNYKKEVTIVKLTDEELVWVDNSNYQATLAKVE